MSCKGRRAAVKVVHGSSGRGLLHDTSTGRAVRAKVVAVAFEGFIHATAAAEDDSVAEVAYATAECLSHHAGIQNGRAILKRLVESFGERMMK